MVIARVVAAKRRKAVWRLAPSHRSPKRCAQALGWRQVLARFGVVDGLCFRRARSDAPHLLFLKGFHVSILFLHRCLFAARTQFG